MSTATLDVSPTAIEQARERLDAWVRELMAWHFDPATGCPFWLEFAEKAGWDPRKEVRTYADLDKFGFFQDEWLREGAVRRWLPKAYEGQPISVFETGGSTGRPKARININDFRIDYEQFSDTLPDEYFPKGADWLSIGPSGPRRLRLAVEHLAQHRGGICFMLDLDPRWVIKLLKWQELDMFEKYKKHVIDQAVVLLKAHPTIKCLFTTPKLLEALCERVSLKAHGITGIFCGGTEMTPQFHRFAVEELVEGAYFAPTYGNTLMGLATHRETGPDEGWAIVYYPPAPRAMIEVVDPDEPTRIVGYGETGRVRLTTLTKEFFMPRFLERDQAEREPPCAKYPWDGVRNVRPFAKLGTVVVEGVY
ncbi:MAG TPA: hypothetical protein VIL35_11970 [Vicinamibacterales bacterium]